MRSYPTQTSSALRAPRPALQRCLRWLAATPLAVGLCLAAAPSAKALTFESVGTNPFYDTNWAPDSGGLSDTSGVNSITFESSGTGINTFTSEVADQSYSISFSYIFEPDVVDEIARAYYQICGASNCTSSPIFTSASFGTGGSYPDIRLASGQSLRFKIQNSLEGGGNLTISNFEATPVPAPLPLLGAGAAFGIIRRRRARLRAAAQAQ